MLEIGKLSKRNIYLYMFVWTQNVSAYLIVDLLLLSLVDFTKNTSVSKGTEKKRRENWMVKKNKTIMEQKEYEWLTIGR